MSDMTPSRWRTLPVQCAALVALILVPVWARMAEPLPLFAPYYLTRFWLFLPVIVTCGLFTLAGFPGIRSLTQSRARVAFVFLLLAFAVWTYASVGWAYMRNRPDISMNAAMQIVIAVLFVVAVASVRLPPSWAIGALLFGLLWNTVLAGQQVALQGAAGGLWASLGEFPIGVEQARISVVQADGVRWLRPYGLLPHPNMLAGFLVMALLAGLGWFAHTDWRRWLTGGTIVALGLWALLLTFSRGSYLALAVGGLVLLVFMRRADHWTRQLAIACAVIAMVGVAFAIVYHPFLLARAGEGNETTEQYSIAERAELQAAALQAIGESPFRGYGAGNLPWRSAYILYANGSIVQGNYPHNIWLTIWGETGIIGVVLLASAVVSAIIAGVRALRLRTGDSPFRAALLAGFIALLVAGMFDYYPVTLLHFQVGWLALAAIALAPSDARVIDSQ